MGKNMWLAVGLSMLILIGYPLFLRWISGPSHEQKIESEIQTIASKQVSEKPPEALSPTGTFLGKPSPPAVFDFENDLFRMQFSSLGASVTRLEYKGENGKKGGPKTIFYQGDLIRPGIFGIRLLHEKDDLTQMIFKSSLAGEEKNLVEFVFEKPGEYRLIKKYHMGSDTPVLGLGIFLENLSPREKHFPVELVYGLEYLLTDQMTQANYEAVVWTDKVESANLGKISKKGFSLSKEIFWAGLIKKYFALLIKPDWKAIAIEVSTDPSNMWAVLKMEPISLAPHESLERHFLVYAGPQRYETLKSFQLGFESVLSKGFFGLFKIWLLIALKFCNQFTHNFGWAIILLTLALKAAFTPLTHMSFQSMKKMQALQPKLKSLQERYKNEPAKLNREMMELYKRNRVNPMGGCLPMVVQIPIFIAFYQVLSDAIELKGAPFIGWISDLSEPDRLFSFPFSIPFIGDSFHLLPLLMLASMYWQQKLTPQAGATPEQTKIMEFMPLIFGFIFYSMPSGLVLYWFVNNVLSIIHQIFVKRMVVVLHHEDRQ
jgi:YidC/Oxa1 family membrane protein insertase